MPWASDKQRRFGNSPTGKAKMGAKVVNEFNQASKGKKLPEAVPDPTPTEVTATSKSNWRK